MNQRALFVVKIGGGGLEFKSDYHQALFKDFLKENVGTMLDIKLHSGELSTEQRGYFEGAIVPAVAEFQNMEIEEARELLKKEFNGRYIFDTKGKAHKVGISTTKLNKKAFSEFLERIIQWMSENGVPIPDPELFKEFKDLALWKDDEVPEKYKQFIKKPKIKKNA